MQTFAATDEAVYFNGATNTGSGLLVGASRSEGALPVVFDSVCNPSWITAVTNSTVCAATLNNNGRCHPHWYSESSDNELVWVCGSLAEGFGRHAVIWHSSSWTIVNASAFGNTIWVKMETFIDNDNVDGLLIASLDTLTMAATNHSTLVRNNKDQSSNELHDEYLDNCIGPFTKGRSLMLAFLSGLPVVATSWFLLRKRNLPSSSLTLYIGVGVMVTMLGGLFDRYDAWGTDGFMVFAMVISPIWLLLAVFKVAVNPQASTGSVWMIYALVILLVGVTIPAIWETLWYESDESK